jgi:hypothetical protein
MRVTYFVQKTLKKNLLLGLYNMLEEISVDLFLVNFLHVIYNEFVVEQKID